LANKIDTTYIRTLTLIGNLIEATTNEITKLIDQATEDINIEVVRQQQENPRDEGFKKTDGQLIKLNLMVAMIDELRKEPERISKLQRRLLEYAEAFNENSE
jgi:hypothetical protein